MASTAGNRQGRQALSLLASCYVSDPEDDDSGDSDHAGGAHRDVDEEAAREGEEVAVRRTRVEGDATGRQAGDEEEAGGAQPEWATAAAGDDGGSLPCEAQKPRPTLFASLPPPRNGASSGPLPSRGNGEGPPSPTRKRKAKGPVKLVVPVLSSADDDEEIRDSAGSDGAKRLKALGERGASTLLALLPKPKNSAVTAAAANSPAAAISMLPASVKAKQKASAAAVPSAKEKASEPPRETLVKRPDARNGAAVASSTYVAVGPDLEEGGAPIVVAASPPAEPAERYFSSSSSFFGCFRSNFKEQEAAADEPCGQEPEAEIHPAYPSEYHQQYPTFPAELNQYYSHDPSQPYDAYARAHDGRPYNQHYDAQGSQTGQSVRTMDLSEVAQVTGMRRGEKGPVQIQDVNVAHVMGSYNPIKDASLQAPKKGGYGHLKPTRMQKAKHNIMALAFQAKEMEDNLQQSWAQSRVTKRQTQSKYGF